MAAGAGIGIRDYDVSFLPICPDGSASLKVHFSEVETGVSLSSRKSDGDCHTCLFGRINVFCRCFRFGYSGTARCNQSSDDTYDLVVPFHVFRVLEVFSRFEERAVRVACN